MVTLEDGRFAYNHESALELAFDAGLNIEEARELARMILGEEYTELQNQAAGKVTGEDWELIADGYYNAIASAINIIDDALDKPRLTRSRETLEEVKNQLENY